MGYLDPYQLLELGSIPPQKLDQATLRRAQRKLMADFDLTEEAVIVRSGIELDKSTALNLVEELKDPVQAALHWQVHQDKGLSSFLRDPLNQHPEVLPQLEIGDLRAFISPYLGEALNRFLRNALRKKDYSAAAEAVEKISYLVFRDQEAAFQSSRSWIDQRLRDLSTWAENINQVNYRSEEVIKTIDKRLIFFLNFLPNRYQTWRNRYAVALIKFALPTVNDRKLGRQAFLAIEAASQLILDEAQERRVKHVFRQLEKYRNSPDPTGKLKAGKTGPGNSSPRKKTSFLRGCFLLWMILITLMVTAAFFTGLFRPSQNKPIRDEFYQAGKKEHGLLWNRRRILMEKLTHPTPYILQPNEEFPPIPKRPYEAFLSEFLLASPLTIDFDSLIVDNQSGYQAVIFISDTAKKTQYNHYFLERGAISSDYPYTSGTIYQCYLGSDWNNRSIPITVAQDRDTTWFGAFTEVRHLPRHDPAEDDPGFVVVLPEKDLGQEEELIRRITITRDSMVIRKEPKPTR